MCVCVCVCVCFCRFLRDVYIDIYIYVCVCVRGRGRGRVRVRVCVCRNPLYHWQSSSIEWLQQNSLKYNTLMVAGSIPCKCKTLRHLHFESLTYWRANRLGIKSLHGRNMILSSDLSKGGHGNNDDIVTIVRWQALKMHGEGPFSIYGWARGHHLGYCAKPFIAFFSGCGWDGVWANYGKCDLFPPGEELEVLIRLKKAICILRP